MKIFSKTNKKRGFTLLLIFLGMIFLAFSGLFDQSKEIVQILRLQKKVLTLHSIDVSIDKNGKMNFFR